MIVWAKLQAGPFMFRILEGAKDLSLLISVQTASGNQTVSCAVGNEGFFLRG